MFTVLLCSILLLYTNSDRLFPYFHRFVCKQPRMDAVPISTGPASGHRWFTIVRQIGTCSQVPDRIVHARRESGRRSVQERDICGRSQSSVVDQRRGWFSRVTG